MRGPVAFLVIHFFFDEDFVCGEACGDGGIVERVEEVIGRIGGMHISDFASVSVAEIGEDAGDVASVWRELAPVGKVVFAVSDEVEGFES